MERKEPVVISIIDVKNHLKNGVTRHNDDATYDPALGSIMEKYTLSKVEVAKLFQDPRLKGLRVSPKKAPAFIIAEDIEETSNISEDATETVSTDEENTSEESATVSSYIETESGIDEGNVTIPF